MAKNKKNQIIEHDFKVGSHPQQVVELTKRITYLTQHLKNFRKDNIAKVSLFRLVNKKKRFLKYISRKNPEAYKLLTAKP